MLRVPLRIGAVAAGVGAVCLMVGTMLHPLGADPGDAVAAFREYAQDDFWVASHLVQFLGVALMFVGLVALRGEIIDERSDWLAGLGVLFGVAAVAIAAALQAADGIALKVMVDAWHNATAPEKQALLQAALAVRQIEIGLASFMAILFGTTAILFGFALGLGTIFPKWLGWIGIAGGAGTISGGILTAFSGFSRAAMNVAMPFNLIVVIWILLIAGFLWRRG